LSKCNKLPLASKLFWLLFSVPRLLLGDNNTQYYVYDYQGSRVRTVIESNQQTQSQRDYLPALDISINQAKQQSTTLHIGTHSAAIGVVVFVTESLGFVIQL
jgi:hypothetical protein